MSNIVQAEFFHVVVQSTLSLREVLEEAAERVADNLLLAQAGIETTTGIKTVVRFHDEGHLLTDVVKKVERLNEACLAGLNQLSLSSGWRRYYLDWRLWTLSRQKWALEKKARRIAVRICLVALNSGTSFVVERMDRSFTAVAPEERHDIRERVQGGKHLWLFIFTPSNLLSDANEGVASMM